MPIVDCGDLDDEFHFLSTVVCRDSRCHFLSNSHPLSTVMNWGQRILKKYNSETRSFRIEQIRSKRWMFHFQFAQRGTSQSYCKTISARAARPNILLSIRAKTLVWDLKHELLMRRKASSRIRKDGKEGIGDGCYRGRTQSKQNHLGSRRLVYCTI